MKKVLSAMILGTVAVGFFFVNQAASQTIELKFAKKLKVMETDWVKEMSANGVPAKELLAAVKQSAQKNR